MHSKPFLSLTLTTLLLLILGVFSNTPAQEYKTVEAAFPGLASGFLKSAQIASLPAGTILSGDKMTIKETDLAQTIGKAPAPLQPQLRKNGIFLLENMTSKVLLLQEAKAAGYNKSQDETRMIRDFLADKVKNITISEEELTRFYEENKAVFGGAPWEQVKGTLKEFLLQQERQKAMDSYVQSLVRRNPVYVNEAWIKKQARLARDNPVDKLRLSGKPSLVDFGATGCGPCDMMTPVLDKLKKKYSGKLNVLFVHVREEQVLSTRYGIQSIPVQVLFDKTGNEVYRHTGFFPEAEIEKKIAQLQLL
jgi:thiol-disulfide isomerase/thioredoxin